ALSAPRDCERAIDIEAGHHDCAIHDSAEVQHAMARLTDVRHDIHNNFGPPFRQATEKVGEVRKLTTDMLCTGCLRWLGVTPVKDNYVVAAFDQVLDEWRPEKTRTAQDDDASHADTS